MKRTLSLVLVVLAISGVALTAFACANPGVGGSGMTYWPWPIESYCWAQVDRCSCSPVSNSLYVEMKVQYLIGSTYYWTLKESRSGNNLQTVKVSFNQGGANAINAKGEAECYKSPYSFKTFYLSK